MADKKHFLRSQDLSASEIETLFWLARRLKRERAEGHLRSELRGRHIALYLEKPSVRTRVSFTVAARELGADVVELVGAQTKLGQGEHPSDFAAVLSRYCHAIVARVFSDASLTEMTKGASVPVINALSDDHHPCQALADFFTLRERFSNLKGLKVAYVGDGRNNVARSLIEMGKQLGVEIRIGAPEGYQPDPAIAEGVLVTTDPKQAVEGVHAVYTDTWVSMGDEAEAETRRKALSAYKVDEALLAGALPEAVVMHCLPAVRDEEIDTAVLTGPRSVVFDQAENRLHTQKALLLMLVENRGEQRPPREQRPQGDRNRQGGREGGHREGGHGGREGGRDGHREGGRDGGHREGGQQQGEGGQRGPRGPRPEGQQGGGQQGGGRGPRPQGGQQGGQQQGGEGGQRGPRGPRPEGQQQRGPRPEGQAAPAEGAEGATTEGQATGEGQQGEGREGGRRRRRRGRGRGEGGQREGGQGGESGTSGQSAEGGSSGGGEGGSSGGGSSGGEGGSSGSSGQSSGGDSGSSGSSGQGSSSGGGEGGGSSGGSSGGSAPAGGGEG